MISNIKNYLHSLLSKKHLLKEAGWYLVAQTITQVSSFLSIILVSRFIGPSNLGLLSFIQNIIAGYMIIISAVDMYTNWSIVTSKDIKKEYISVLYQKLVITTIAAFLLFILAYLFLPRNIFYMMVCMVLPLFTSLFTTSIFILQYYKQAKLFGIASSISAILLFFAKLILVWFSFDIKYLLFVYSLDGIILSATAFYFCKKYFKISFWNKKDFFDSVTLVEYKKIFLNSIFPFLYLIFWYLVTRVDQILLPYWYDAHTLGLYSASVKISETTNVFIGIIQAVLIPRVLHHMGSDSGNYIKKTLLLYLASGVIFASGITLFSKFIIEVLYGSSYLNAQHILSVYAWTIPGMFCSYCFVVYFMAAKKYTLLALHAGITAFLTLILLFYAYEKGVETIALVSVVSYTFSGLLYWLIWKNYIKKSIL